jgi:hypothetical protein
MEKLSTMYYDCRENRGLPAYVLSVWNTLVLCMFKGVESLWVDVQEAYPKEGITEPFDIFLG